VKIALVTFMLVLLPLPPAVQEEDFNVRLIHQLSLMMNREAPATITIEILPQEEMLNRYRDWLYRNCFNTLTAQGYPLEVAVSQCREMAIQSARTIYVHGKWVNESDPTHFHALIDEHSGMSSVIHEFCHFVLDGITPIINQEAVVRPMAELLLTSPRLKRWLEENR